VEPVDSYRSQLGDAGKSIAPNVQEGTGRRAGPNRNLAYRYARGSAEEADEYLRANFAAGGIPGASYWRMHNRIALVVKVLNGIIGD
jgi:four helix bundle protein